MISLLRSVAFLPLVTIFQACRKEFFRVWCIVFVGAAVAITRSVTFAYVGWVGEKFRYALSHISLIALFRASRFSRFRPPSSMGCCRASNVIQGEESSSHIKSRIIFTRAFSIVTGMPWAFVKNCVWPPAIV